MKNPNSKKEALNSELLNKSSKDDYDNIVDVEAYQEDEIDKNYICHRLYKKDFIIDLENLPFVQFYKLKAKNKVFSFIGVNKA